MSRKWPIVRFGSLDAANKTETGSLAVGGAEGVSLALSLQRFAGIVRLPGAPQRDRRGVGDESASEGEGEGG